MEFESMIQKPRTMAQEPRMGLAGGQLVQNTADGSRPGYGGDEFSLEKNLSRVPPQIRERFIKVNNYLKKIIPELNAGEKHFTKEQVSSMVEKKFNLEPKYKMIGGKKYKVNKFSPDAYPVMKNLDSVETKIENTLKNMLIEDKPLNDFWYKALEERTGLNRRTLALRIGDSPTYKVIKDQGAGSLKNRFNKVESHSFLKELSFSDQLTTALEMEQGMPRYTGMGKEKYFSNSPKFKVFEFAKRNFNNNKGNGVVKFFNKNGKRIIWDYGLELPYKDVYFTYNGKKYSASDKIKNTNNLTDINILKKDFPEVYKNQTAINNLVRQKIDNPYKTGDTVGDLVKAIQVNSYKWPRISIFDILHGKKGVTGEPFTNLSFNTRDINQLEMGINQNTTLSQMQKNKLTKTLNELAGSGDPKTIIKRQISLAKDFKAGNIKSYEDMKKVMYKKANIFKTYQANGIGKNCKAYGGRVGFGEAGAVGVSQCMNNAIKEHNKNLQSDDLVLRNKARSTQFNINKTKNMKSILNLGGKGVSKALRFGKAWGAEWEPIFEGAFYEWGRRKGYTHEQALEETFFTKLLPKDIQKGVFGAETQTGLLEGADPLLEKELYEIRGEEEFIEPDDRPPIQHPEFGKIIGERGTVKKYIDNEKALMAARNKYSQLVSAYNVAATGRYGDPEKAEAYAKAAEETWKKINSLEDKLDLDRDTYQAAVEKQQHTQGTRALEYGEYGSGDTEKLAKQREKRRQREMEDKFPLMSKAELNKKLEAAGLYVDPKLRYKGKTVQRPEGLDFLKGWTPEKAREYFRNLDKSAYFAENFRMEKAQGGIMNLKKKW
jgi:hypothetical protein